MILETGEVEERRGNGWLLAQLCDEYARVKSCSVSRMKLYGAKKLAYPAPPAVRCRQRSPARPVDGRRRRSRHVHPPNPRRCHGPPPPRFRPAGCPPPRWPGCQ